MEALNPATSLAINVSVNVDYTRTITNPVSGITRHELMTVVGSQSFTFTRVLSSPLAPGTFVLLQPCCCRCQISIGGNGDANNWSGNSFRGAFNATQNWSFDETGVDPESGEYINSVSTAVDWGISPMGNPPCRKIGGTRYPSGFIEPSIGFSMETEGSVPGTGGGAFKFSFASAPSEIEITDSNGVVFTDSLSFSPRGFADFFVLMATCEDSQDYTAECVITTSLDETIGDATAVGSVTQTYDIETMLS